MRSFVHSSLCALCALCGERSPTRRGRVLGAGIAALIALAPRLAVAQELGVTAEVERPIARTGGEDPTASATEIDARDRPRALDTLEDGLLEVPGARPLRSGAYGSPSSLSLRGADGDQLEVLFGDVPITTADGTAFDLSAVPLYALERVEVYRGGAPTWLGVGGIGGVLRLVPRTARGTRMDGALGAGSFGLWHGRLGASVASDDVRWLATVGATSSEGDFPYLDDRRTALDPSDDVERPRENGQLREGSGLGHLVVPLAGGHLSAFVFGLARHGGVAGAASSPTRHARRNEAQLLGAIGWERTEGDRPVEDADWRVGLTLSAAGRRRRVHDPYGEIGQLPRSSDDATLRTVARAAASGRALPWLELTGVALYTHEQLWPEDRLAGVDVEPSARNAGHFGVEARLFGRVDDVRLELRPSARLAVIDAQLAAIDPDRLGEESASLTLAPTARLGAAIEPVRGLTIAASAATATRAPTMLELFGDRAFLRGDPRLAPERAETFDLGVVLRGREGPLTGSAELRGFVTLGHDLIRYVRNTLYEAVPANVGEATLAGAELGVSGTITRHLALRGALTALETWTPYLGGTSRLPLRPSVNAYARIEGRVFALGPLDRFVLFVDVTHVAGAFVDAANLTALADRTRVGLGVSMSLYEQRARIDLGLSDAFDARGTDLLGFPLPGRALSVSLSLRTE